MNNSNDLPTETSLARADVVREVFRLANKNPETVFVPQQEKGLAFAPTNIALCKYWGKRNEKINLPMTSSLSITLPDRGAMTDIRLSSTAADIFRLNGEVLDQQSNFSARLREFLNLFRPNLNWFLDIRIEMTIPVAAGLASSACGFASLVAAMNDLFAWELPLEQLSILARLGSGSATRSFWPGFVEWHAGNQADGMDSFGAPLTYEWPELCIAILPINLTAKSISSREAMRRTVNSSLLYAEWPKKVAQDLILLKQAIKTRNIALLGGTAESNALTMHATMLGCWPPICYYQPETIAAMQKIWKLREHGLNLFFTQDAGPNLKLIFLLSDQHAVTEHFKGIEPIVLFQ